MDASSIKSSELYTAAKIIGRECSEANLDYYNCKKELGENPKACKSQGSRVNKCVTAMYVMPRCSPIINIIHPRVYRSNA